jgi:hypothetical protein
VRKENTVGVYGTMSIALLELGGDRTMKVEERCKKGRKDSESERKLIGVNGNILPCEALTLPRISPAPDTVLIKYCTQVSSSSESTTYTA